MLKKFIIYIFFILITQVFSLSIYSMSYDESRHLLSRVNFNITSKSINNLKNLDKKAAVNSLINSLNKDHHTLLPDWVFVRSPDFKNMTKLEKKEFRKKQRQLALKLKAWWFREMVETDSQLTEKLVVFWHNHFTSGMKKVKSPILMYQQNILFRKNALGSFRYLLHSISRDPAMTLYLDNQRNNKNKPNENFARELLELFTLGEGNYTEKDIKEAARAFTGWKINKKNNLFFFNKRQHDFGQKHFLGNSGNFNGDDIIDIILENPKTALFVTKKFWKEFISENPNETELKRISNIFYEKNYDLKILLSELLSSKYFYEKKNIGNKIKSPVELIVGTLRTFKGSNKTIDQFKKIAQYSKRMGQDIFDPPNVKGWLSGTYWINTNTILQREQFIRRFTRGKDMNRMMSYLNEYYSDFSETKRLLLPIEPINIIKRSKNNLINIRNIMLDPVYQLN